MNRHLLKKQDDILLLLGKLHSERIKNLPEIKSFKDVEFRIFSQWGEDGIIQYLISKINIPNDIFIEFGVSNYLESNTRFLLMNNNWQGLIIDDNPDNIDFVKKSDLYWQYNLTAIAHIIDRDNINSLIGEHIQEKDIGLLSIDIDGNDYWVWKNINIISPRIIICEYNSSFGCEHDVTIPYEPHFNRTKAHHSNLYYGASLSALCDLAEEKGYSFVGCNSAGNNAFFVRNDLVNPFKVFLPEDYFIKSKFRESRNEDGQLTYIKHEDILKEIQFLPLYEIKAGKTVTIKEMYNL